MLSDRAKAFIQSFERRQYVEDLNVVAEALEKHGIPVTQPVLEFHRTFAGYVGKVWLNEFVFGIVQAHCGWYTGYQVDAFEHGDTWLIACAATEPQDAVYIDLDGRYYGFGDCDGPTASSFFMSTEQSAFIDEWTLHNHAKRIRLLETLGLFQDTVLPRLGGYEVAELSDEYSDVYLVEHLLVRDDSYLTDAWIVPGKTPSVLAGFPLNDLEAARPT